jgi:hypothetical protein
MYEVLNIPQDNYQAGLIIGQHSRRIMQEYVLSTKLWQSLKAWIGSERLKNMETAARSAFPQYVDELAGIAEGCELPFSYVFLWNCRGDLSPFISDGCTTVCAPSSQGILLGHNEDGDPKLRSHCFISKREPESNDLGFTSFTYPASINGHTFSVNSAGIVQLVDNIRSLEYGDGVPRQLLSRAILDCRNLDEVISTLKGCHRAGSFHHMLAQAGTKDVISVEYIPDDVSIVRLQASYGHANHFIHPRFRNSKQRITRSSAARQIRIDDLCGKLSNPPGFDDIRLMLCNIENPELPIYRMDPDDPDKENNLATALFHVTPNTIHSRVYVAGDQAQAFTHNI